MTQIVLIILKCCKILNCSWGIILLPLWLYLLGIVAYISVLLWLHREGEI